MHSHRRFLYLAVLGCAAGCASVEPIRLGPASPAYLGFEIADGRTGAAIGGRTFDIGSERAEFLADGRFSPSRMEFLGSALQRCCLDALAGRRVVVTDFDVSFRKTMPTLLTDAAGAALYRELRSIGASRTSCVRVRVEVGPNTYSGSQCEDVGTPGESEAVRTAASGAVEKMASDIRSQPPKEPAASASAVAGNTAAVSVAGFAVRPPEGDGWLRIGAGRGASYARRLAQDHTAAAQALPVPENEQPNAASFEAAIRARVQSRLLPGRNRLEREVYRATVVAGLECIAYELDIIDSGPVAGATPLLIQVIGHVCRRAVAGGDWIEMSFSERGGPRGFTPEVRKHGETFLASLRG